MVRAIIQSIHNNKGFSVSEMSKSNYKEIKEKLIAERDILIEKLKGNDLSVDDSETPDPVDLAVRNYSKNVMLAVSENESRQLALIDEALLRIDDEEYGPCQNCQNDINPKRLACDTLGPVLFGLPGAA